MQISDFLIVLKKNAKKTGGKNFNIMDPLVSGTVKHYIFILFLKQTELNLLQRDLSG